MIENDVDVDTADQPNQDSELWDWSAAGIEWQVVADDPFEVSLLMSATADGETLGLCDLPLKPMALRQLYAELGAAVDAQRAVDGLPPLAEDGEATPPMSVGADRVEEADADNEHEGDMERRKKRFRRLVDPAGVSEVAASLDDRLPSVKGMSPSALVFIGFVALTAILLVSSWMF